MSTLHAHHEQREQPTQPILAPVDQEGTKAIVRAWLKPSGASVRKDEPIVELETDKVLVEVCAPCDGTLEIVVADQAEALPGSVLGHVHAQGRGSESAVDSVRTRSAADVAQRLSPSVRKFVAEHSIDPSGVEGTGRGGRLTRADVVRALEHRDSQPVNSQPTDRERDAVREAVRNAAAHSQHASVRVPHSAMRRRIAEHMQQSVSTAPHVTAVFQADFSAIIAHRKQHQSAFAANGVPLTYTSYFVAASVQAMRAVPEVNSRWHDDSLEVFGDINIGVGASLGDKGLIVPVIHQAQDLSLLGIASRLQRATEAARSGKLKPADVQGGTFTISNHGVAGSLIAAPIIINQPQCAILGIGAVEKRVVVREVNGNDAMQIVPCAYVSLTIDHRALDGGQTNAWLARFVEVIEQWPIDSVA
ncbi:MAG TPA: 2-oxo acid dehydrogenase subunit E2 [Pararobbsia sp.]|nr:2-oxo acid dehydrogenase subunit E2 [Pararobbsia sp.]